MAALGNLVQTKRFREIALDYIAEENPELQISRLIAALFQEFPWDLDVRRFFRAGVSRRTSWTG